MLSAFQLRATFTIGFLCAVLFSVFQTTSGQTCAPPPAGLVSFWPGDGTANDFQSTNHATLENGATFGGGQVGPAFSFDGTDDSALTPTINIGTTFSIELWIFPTRVGAFQHLVSNDFTSTNYGALYFVSNHVEYWQGATLRARTPTGSVPLNAWTHVALTYNPVSGVAQLYLNGVTSGAPSAGHTETFNNPLRFGYAVAASDNPFQGRLDEISLYNTSLSGADILSIFNAGSAGKCVAPALIINDTSVIEGNAGTTPMNFTVTSIRSTVAAMVNFATADGTATAPSDYTATNGTVSVPASGTATITVLVNGDTALEQNETLFVNLSNPVNAVIVDGQGIGTIFSDDCVASPLGVADWYKAEGNANDSVGNNHGTLENGATFATGNTGQAFSFDGVNASVLTPTINLGSAFTVELWILPTRNNGGFENLVANSFASAANYGAFYYDNDHLEYWQGNTPRAVSPAVLPLNTWTHVALTYDGSFARLYVNGSLSATSGSHAETFNNPLRFGFSVVNQDSHFRGLLDEVTLYSRALSAAEIQTIYSAFGGGKCGVAGNNWTGAVSSDWHTPGNWSSGVVPTAPTDVVIPAAGVVNEAVINTADATISTLNVASNRTLTVNGGRTLTVNNDLINIGTLAGAGTINSQGTTTSNSGTISVANFNFNRAGAQTLSGSGSFSTDTATVISGSALMLSSNHQFSSLVIQGGATLDITSRTLSLSGNLTNNGALTITNSTVVANGATPQTLTNANYRNLTANNPAGVNLGSNATVSDLLTLTSDLTTGAFVLTMPFATQDTAGGGDVIGNFRLTNPAGFPSKYGNPFVRIGVGGGTLPTDITVNLVKAAPSGAMAFPNAVQRTYTITPNGGVGFTATVQLHYLDAELNGNAEGAALSLWRFNGATWEKKTTNAFSTIDNWVQTINVAQFSPWTLNSTVPTAAPANISGQVTNADGAPLAGVLMTLTGSDVLRRTITNSEGFYQFTDVRTDAFYSLSPMRANYAFAPAERSFSLLANKTDAVFMAHALPQTANPLDTPEFFVRQQYIDFLGREPDRGGFEYWSHQINQCGDDQTCTRAKRVDVSNAFFYEQEFQATGAYVYRIYKAALDQAPTFGQFLSDRGRVIGGPQLDQSKTDFANAFVQRAAFAAQYPDTMSAAQYVDALNAKIGDALTQAERDELVNGLMAGAETRATVLRKIADNAAFIDREYNASFVLTQYFGYLHRDPDRAGFAFWLDQVNRHPLRDVSIQHAMVCSFVTSTEYQQRFSSVVTHTNAECPH